LGKSFLTVGALRLVIVFVKYLGRLGNILGTAVDINIGLSLSNNDFTPSGPVRSKCLITNIGKKCRSHTLSV